MYEKIEKAILVLVLDAEDVSEGSEAMKYSQAALNLAHVIATLEGARQLRENK